DGAQFLEAADHQRLDVDHGIGGGARGRLRLRGGKRARKHEKGEGSEEGTHGGIHLTAPTRVEPSSTRRSYGTGWRWVRGGRRRTSWCPRCAGDRARAGRSG